MCTLPGEQLPEERMSPETRLKFPSLNEDCWTSATGQEGVLVDEVAPQQEEAEYVWGDRVHATVPER